MLDPLAAPHETTCAEDTTLYLRDLHDRQTATPRIYLHPKPVSFYTSRDKADWRAYVPDAADRDTFATFIKARLDGALTAAALFQTWGGTYVGQPIGQWDEEDWHCWIGAMVKIQGGVGKVIVIWDSNARAILARLEKPPALANLAAPMRKLVRMVQETGVRVEQVWYGGDGNRTVDGICTQLSVAQLEIWAACGVPGETDGLVKHGFTKVQG